MTNPWAPLAEGFAHRYRVPRGAATRVPLPELATILPRPLTAALDGLELWGEHAALIDLHGVRAAPARQHLATLFDAPLWVVSTGKGEGVMRAVLREVVEGSDSHVVVRWAGETPSRPVPSLAVVARRDVAEAVEQLADELATPGVSWRTWLVVWAIAAAILYEFCLAH